MKRALVFGGGGPVGFAWETAIATGLLDHGIDLRDAGIIVGTSAGAVVGTHLARARDPHELAERRRAAAPPLNSPSPDVAALTEIFTVWGTSDERCAAVGHLALAAKTMPEEQWLAGFAETTPATWPPTPLLITAVDAESGEFRLFDAASGVDAFRAVAASCSVPGMAPPVTIAGRRYMDGGVRSGTSADAAAASQPDLALIIAAMGASERGVGALAARQIERETAQLEAADIRVRAIRFDAAAIEACGGNLMDRSRAEPTAAAGSAHAATIASGLAAWWAGKDA